MQFAKLFDFPTGQLLVEQGWVAFGSDGTGYSTLVLTTKYQAVIPNARPVTATTKVVFPTSQECADDFEAYDEERATRTFENHQHYLAQGRGMTFSTSHEVRYERPDREHTLQIATSSMVVPELVEGFIKDMFLTYRVGKLEMSADWLAKALSKSTDCRVNAQELRWYLTDELGLKSSSIPKHLRIPIKADYSLLDEQGHPQISAYHDEVGRAYKLLVQDWLTAEELIVFSESVSEVAD